MELPIDILRQIQNYLNQEDYFYFINSSKDRRELKRNTIYFALNEQHSRKFIQDAQFRSKVLERIQDPTKQISLKLGSGRFQRLEGISVDKISITCSFTEMNNLPDSVNRIHAVCEAYGIREVSPNMNINKLSLRHCDQLTSFSSIYHLQKIEIITAPLLTDVSPLKNIRTIYLSHCENIHDVSSLKGVYDLHLNRCRNVSDISGLGNHHRLYISFCAYNLIGYESLLHIPHVGLYECDIHDLTVLQYAKSVRLDKCRYATDATPIKNAKKVQLVNFNITNLIELKDIDDLSLIQNKVTNEQVEFLTNRCLTIDAVDIKVNNYSFLYFIRHLTISPNRTLIHFIHKGEIDFFLQI